MAVLCIGPLGSGKTLLLKRLSQPSIDETTSTVETVGSNIVSVPHKTPVPHDKGGKKKALKDKDCCGVREVGGSLAPLWPSYYNSTKLIMFVLDASNLFQVSIGTTLLMEMLSHEKLIQTKFLVVLNKKDLATKKGLNYLKFMMRLDGIILEGGGSSRVSVEEVSSITGEGVEHVRSWMVRNSSASGKVTTTVKVPAAAKKK